MHTPGLVIPCRLNIERADFFASFKPDVSLIDIDSALLDVIHVTSNGRIVPEYTDKHIDNPKYPPMDSLLESYVKHCNTSQQLANELMSLSQMSINNPGFLMMYNDKYEQWLRSQIHVEGCISHMLDNVSMRYVLLDSDKGDIIWLKIPSIDQLIPLYTKFWKRNYINGMSGGQEVCYSGISLGGLPNGTIIYHYDKVYQLGTINA